MSRFFVCETVYEDRAVILEVLRELGYEPRLSEEGVALSNYYGRTDSTMKANIIIPKDQLNRTTGASNDIGFVKQDGKYKLILDDYDSRYLKAKDPITGKMENFEQAFQRSYVVKAAQRKLMSRGITGFRLDKTKVTVDAKGRVQVVLRR